MKKKLLINYWDNYYNNITNIEESSFARFVKKRIKKNSELIDIGCGNGRDSFFFSRNNLNVTAIDISKNAIKKNSIKKRKNLKFQRFDTSKDILNKKFDVFYCRFFIHAISKEAEEKLIFLIKRNKKKNSLAFFEFRNHKDEIFNGKNKKNHNDIVEFEKGHFRRIIKPNEFINTFKNKIKSKVIYNKSSKNLSIVNKDNPNLSRIIFKF